MVTSTIYPSTTVDASTTVDDLQIILNNLLDKPIGNGWDTVLKTAYPTYNVDKTWELNRTVIVNHNNDQKKYIFPLDIFMTTAVMVINNSNDDIIKTIESVIKYLTNTIRGMCPMNIANILKFNFNFYIPLNHKDDSTFHCNNFVNMIGESVEKTILGRALPEKMRWYQVELKFNNNWDLKETNPSRRCNCSQHSHINRCF
jgi:hypothetical protein